MTDEMTVADRDLVRRYLLGTVAEADRAGVEERLFNDPTFFEAAELIEDDLIEEYAQGRVPEEERSAFEAFLSSRGRRRQLDLTLQLQRELGSPSAGAPGQAAGVDVPRAVVPLRPTPRATTWWPSLAVAASLVIATAAAVSSVRQAATIGQLTASLERTTAEVSALRQQAAVPEAVRSLVVEPDTSVRGAGGSAPVVQVAAGARQVQLEFAIPNAVRTDRVILTIQRPDGTQVWGGVTATTDTRQAVVARVPAAVLVADDYTATVAEPDGTAVARYRFRVVIP
jgi:hypothetical protein